MYYVIQENLFKEYNFKHLVGYLDRYNIEYEVVKYLPFSQEMPFKTKRKDVFFFGWINGEKCIADAGWNPGSLFNSNHDFDVYGPKYGDNMLNSDAKTGEFGPIMGNGEIELFIRPTKDTKSFVSKVYAISEWNSYITETMNSDTFDQIAQETKMMWCEPKSGIQQEIRCWIVDGEPVTMSQYKIGRRVNMLNMDNNEEAYIFSKKMAKLYSPARAYVMDICLYNDEYKIVEINCINMSGFYDANMSKLIQSLENAFNEN
jgi:hypothetical protein